MDEFDNLFDKIDNVDITDTIVEILFIGTAKRRDLIEKYINNYNDFSLTYSDNIDQAINMLLLNQYKLIIIEDGMQEYNPVAFSRIIKINNPISKVIMIISLRSSKLIADMVNKGNVDALISFPISKNSFYNILVEQNARYEIDSAILEHIQKPPKLSKASYLLLDPTLSFGDEKIKPQFIGYMIAYNSVPRYSHFFEPILQKDDILFSGYLSGIIYLGIELFENKEPIKQINFGGVSVVLRFHNNLQIAYFVKNLSSENVEYTEEIINLVTETLLSECLECLSAQYMLTQDDISKLNKITSIFEKKNEEVIKIIKEPINYVKNKVIILGKDNLKHDKLIKYFSKNDEFSIISTTDKNAAQKMLESENFDVLLLDSSIDNAIDFAWIAKEITPTLQLIYWIRDRRAPRRIVSIINRGLINYIVPYREPYKNLRQWLYDAINKSEKLKSRVKLNNNIMSVLSAKSILKENVDAFTSEDTPIFNYILITKETELIYSKFISGDKLEFNDEILGGLIVSLKMIGKEAIKGNEILSNLQMGGRDILMKNIDKYYIGFIIQNLSPTIQVVLEREIDNYSEQIYAILKNNGTDITDTLNPIINQIAEDFQEKFGA